MPAKEGNQAVLSDKKDKNSEKEKEKELKKALTELKDNILNDVIIRLDLKKSSFERIIVNHLFDDRFRINLWGRNKGFLCIEHSYFIKANPEGIYFSQPALPEIKNDE